jgi:hypothetical protein
MSVFSSATQPKSHTSIVLEDAAAKMPVNPLVSNPVRINRNAHRKLPIRLRVLFPIKNLPSVFDKIKISLSFVHHYKV